jgi:hypothetical protein
MGKYSSFKIKLKWWIHEHHIAILFITALIAVAVGVYLYYKAADWKYVATLVGSLISFVFVVQKQTIDEAKLFKELFIEFNKRYDALNAKLNGIKREENRPLYEIEGAVDTLFDYFNLCAEEYLFYKRGFIYPEIWESWVKGMSAYFGDSRIRSLWSEERKTESYYGFDFDREMKRLKVK